MLVAYNKNNYNKIRYKRKPSPRHKDNEWEEYDNGLEHDEWHVTTSGMARSQKRNTVNHKWIQSEALFYSHSVPLLI